MNSIFTIKPYRVGAIWAFDDAVRQLAGEPFVGDINRMIDKLVVLAAQNLHGGACGSKLGIVERNLTLLFAPARFPGSQVQLVRCEPDSGGFWYACPELQLKGWLCPVLFKFFPEPPEKIWVQAVAR